MNTEGHSYTYKFKLDCEIIVFFMSNPTLISVCNQFSYTKLNFNNLYVLVAKDRSREEERTLVCADRVLHGYQCMP